MSHFDSTLPVMMTFLYELNALKWVAKQCTIDQFTIKVNKSKLLYWVYTCYRSQRRTITPASMGSGRPAPTPCLTSGSTGPRALAPSSGPRNSRTVPGVWTREYCTGFLGGTALEWHEHVSIVLYFLAAQSSSGKNTWVLYCIYWRHNPPVAWTREYCTVFLGGTALQLREHVSIVLYFLAAQPLQWREHVSIVLYFLAAQCSNGVNTWVLYCLSWLKLYSGGDVHLFCLFGFRATPGVWTFEYCSVFDTARILWVREHVRIVQSQLIVSVSGISRTCKSHTVCTLGVIALLICVVYLW